jgi:Tfp pilus assembly protein PilF
MPRFITFAGCVALCVLTGGVAVAEPYRPASPNVVLERLPLKRSDPQAAALAADRARLAAQPADAELALRVADQYFDLAGAEGDPRYIGYAQAALAPWANDRAAPADLLFMRGKLLQWRHEFKPALELFGQVLSREPDHFDALTWRAAVLTVLADYDGARRDCNALRRTARELFWASCLAYVDGLTGHAADAGHRLADLLARHADASPGNRLWLLTRLADLAERQGRAADADRHYRRALALGITSQYLLANYADFLNDAGRHAEVVTLLKEWTRSDVLLLRLTFAEQALGVPEFKVHAQALRERFAAAALRGDTLHQQEESRFRLRVEQDVARALELAAANWVVQREPYDARILLEAAVAARRPGQAQPVLDWLAASRHEDPRLAALAGKLRAGRRP